jgi:hypothetical protein
MKTKPLILCYFPLDLYPFASHFDNPLLSYSPLFYVRLLILLLQFLFYEDAHLLSFILPLHLCHSSSNNMLDTQP